MITSGTLLKGSSGRSYTLGAEIAHGGEGIVFHTDSADKVAKIYINNPEENEKKILYMTGLEVNTRTSGPDATPIIAWPEDALYCEDKFVGYIMPMVKDTMPIFQVSRRGKRAEEFFGGKDSYSWITHMTIAFNLANTVRYLHEMGCIIGDMNGKNIVVHKNGLVTLLDVDSFDLTDPDTGNHYPCVVGRPEFLPPELQGKDLRNAKFTVHSDEFGLAVHIFRLLLNNRHPFDVKINQEGSGSVSESHQEYNISMGKCAYVRTMADITIPPNEPTMDMLPDELKQDFENTFNYTDENAVLPETLAKRTTAQKWYEDLKDLAIRWQELFQKCGEHPFHYYLKSKNVCEFCRVGADGPITGPGPGPQPPKNGCWILWLLIGIVALWIIIGYSG